ncbi:hypothetical protein HNP82_001956 [Catenibacillus scindens]|uniref:Uncharacterized protein n=1 Tax=Catenibacillus scindens TaxID=673271 RepID=A0A7W8M5Q7_9FIRM|nr:hypothetical protein [Catenibacillus scindens]MBB5264817.1 hypothetical protein [Catenibacillus scindens]
MSEPMKKINVEEIMKEIREEIAQKGYTEDSVDYANIAGDAKAILGVKTDFSAYELGHAVNGAAGQHKIEYYRMIPKGGLKSFIERSIRKILRFMLIPMVDQQNQFNYQMVVCMRQMEGFIEEHNHQMEQKDRQIDALEEKIFYLTKRCEALEKQCGSKEA